MNITPRKDVKDLSRYKSAPKSVDVPVLNQPRSIDIIDEACSKHGIDRRYVEKVKTFSENDVLISFRAPISRKIRYERIV